MNIYKGLKKCLSGVLKFLFNIHIHGCENEPMDTGYIAVSNHISFIDVIVTAIALKRQVMFMAKKELFKIPILSQLIKSLGAFSVDRRGNSAASIKKSIALLKEGNVVGMFPQGHRYSGVKFDTTKEHFKGGAAMSCYRSKAPVLPMFIATKNDRIALFRRIDIYIGKPIEYEEFGFTEGGNDEYMRGTELIYNRILALVPEERRSK